METKKGACRFCGQNKMIEVPNGYTQEEIDEEVTCECKCDEAKAYQEKKEREERLEAQKLSAKGTTFELFHNDFPEVEEILNNAIADEVLLMKKGKLVLQGTVPELIHKANGKVWELSVSPQEARQWQTKTTVANLRHEGKEIILRITSDNMPSERAVPCEATLEDLYLFYFPTEEGVK